MGGQNTAVSDGKQITGKHVFWTVVGFFFIVGLVNLYMIYQAVGTFRGEDTKQSYLQGLQYNQTLEARKLQNDLHWKAKLTIADHKISIKITKEDGTPIRGLQVSGLLKHPAETELDNALVFQDMGSGVYTATYDANIKGSRHLLTEARAADGTIFKTRNDELWLK
ncbi:MAG TPA: hypothetical protein ENJ42_10180 [Hellea balneolensis]|uniref:Nitrogen fixation protein FixH n=1 Tax=Hellea balneolensis TaxID=287478 RepID=A0A7C5LYD9_9PROT|nr:hypothetical protein [Hellea balneolensis]